MPAALEEQTRNRLLNAAGEVFAEQGFQATTVREICARADANVASVNYHFRDKMALYLAVLENSICAASPAEIRLVLSQAESAEQALAGMIRYILGQMYNKGERNAWHVRIMAHELAHPTGALDLVIEKVIGPNYAAMRDVISRIIGLPPDHDTIRLYAHSVIAQVVHYAHARPVIARLWPDLELTQDRINQIAAHIAQFSLDSLHAQAKRMTHERNTRE